MGKTNFWEREREKKIGKYSNKNCIRYDVYVELIFIYCEICCSVFFLVCFFFSLSLFILWPAVVRSEYVTIYDMQLINIHRCIADIYTTQTWHTHSLCARLCVSKYWPTLFSAIFRRYGNIPLWLWFILLFCRTRISVFASSNVPTTAFSFVVY